MLRTEVEEQGPSDEELIRSLREAIRRIEGCASARSLGDLRGQVGGPDVNQLAAERQPTRRVSGG